jgi:hypothetical protein
VLEYNKVYVLESINNIIIKVNDATKKLKYDSHEGQDVWAMSLHGSIIEYSHSCLVLMNSELYSSIPIITRSSLEALAALKLTLQNKDNYKFLFAKYYKQKYDNFRQLRNVESLKVIQMPDEDMQEIELEARAQLEACKLEKYNPLGVIDTMNKSKMSVHHITLYRSLCSSAHNNITSLEDRHIEKNDDAYGVVVFKEPGARQKLILIEYFLPLLIESVETMVNHFSSADEIGLSEIMNMVLTLRESYLPDLLSSSA